MFGKNAANCKVLEITLTTQSMAGTQIRSNNQIVIELFNSQGVRRQPQAGGGRLRMKREHAIEMTQNT